MHFHLPKPLHGWREFAGEVGIIVIGVLIALSAEQVVEDLHWHREAEQTREAIGNEVADHYVTASEMVIAQPCVDQQLARLELVLLKPGAYVPPSSVHTGIGDFPYIAPTRVWADNVWKSAESEGAVSHFEPDLRFRLSGYYAQVEAMRGENRAADLLWYRSRVLSLPVQPDAATRSGLIEQIEETRGHFAYMKLVGNQLLGQLDDMDMRPPQDFLNDGLRYSRTLQFCREHRLPLGKTEPDHAIAEPMRAFEKRRGR